MNHAYNRSRRTSPVVLALHAVALALFALVIGGGAGTFAIPLVGAGFALLACSYATAARLPARQAAPARVPRFATQPERAPERARVTA